MTAKVTHIFLLYIQEKLTHYTFIQNILKYNCMLVNMYLFCRRSSSLENTACIYDIAITALLLTLEKPFAINLWHLHPIPYKRRMFE